MIQQLRQKINSLRQNYLSKKRKKSLALHIDKAKVLHLNKAVNCHAEWYGNSYGGFYINPKLLSAKSVVYSFGIGKDVSFDKMCIKKHKCNVFGFDPTPKSINYVKNNFFSSLFVFFDFGISHDTSGFVNFYLPKNPKAVSGSLKNTDVVNKENFIEVKMKTFTDITKQLNHQHIDVLKMDIEGAEYEVLENIINSDITIDQILVEFHDRLFNLDNYKSKDIVQKLNEKGYRVFAHSISYEEVSFIHQRNL